MNRSLLLHLAPLALAFTLAGCASSDGDATSTTNGDADAITPQEIAEGEAAPAVATGAEHADGAEPTNGADGAEAETGLVIATPREDSKSFLDEEEARLEPQPIVPGVIDPDGPQLTESCQRASGYRSGRRITICVTTIDGHYVEVNTARAYLRMRKAARQSGITLHVVSGFRSMSEQRHLYHCYKTRSCNGGHLAAVPGYSNHQSGHALDLNTNAGGVYSFLANHGHAYGFRRTVAIEKWHWEH